MGRRYLSIESLEAALAGADAKTAVEVNALPAA